MYIETDSDTLSGDFPRRRVIEFGHYYSVTGPTEWSLVGLEIAMSLKKPDDETMLFVDDIHGVEEVNEAERCLPVVSFNPDVDHLVGESEVIPEALRALDILKGFPRKRRARLRGKGRIQRWSCSGFWLTDKSGEPSCILLDVGLTLRKRDMGFRSGINILPEHYEEQQVGVQRLLRKVAPDFHLETLLYSLNGTHALVR